MGKALHYTLWTVQVLLALLFLFAGVMKFFTPTEQFGPLPVWFVYFIGVCEILGGLGLVLPGLFKRKPVLTPLAALGLFIIMVGAVVTSWPMGLMFAAIPAVIGLLTAFVAYGRWKLLPLEGV